MKFLTQSYRNFSPTRHWTWVDTNPDENQEASTEGWENNSLIKEDIKRQELEDNEKKDKILELLDNPISFSLRDVHFIEDNLDLVEKDKSFRLKFRKTAEYFLSLSVVNNTIIPPRVLYQLNGSKLTKRFLPVKIQRGIQLVVDKHTEEIQSLADEDPSQWSMSKTSKLITLYKYLKKRNQKSGHVLDDSFKSITEKLIKKAVSLTQKEHLTSNDQLILWEIRNQIPEDLRFSGEIDKILRQKSQINPQELIDNILSDKTKNNPSLILLWDLLEDLAYNGKVQITEQQKKKVKNFVLRGNATQLLEAVSKSSPKVFLPIHIKAFKQLGEDRFKNLWQDTNDLFEEEIKIDQTEEDKAHIEKYEKEIAKIKDQIRDLEEEEFQVILSREGSVLSDKRIPYDKALQRLESYTQENFSGLPEGPKTIDELVHELKNTFGESDRKPFNTKLSPLFAQFESESNTRKKFKILSKIIQSIKDFSDKGINEIIRNENKGNVREKTLNTVQDIKNVILEHTGVQSENTDEGSTSSVSDIPLWNDDEVVKVEKILEIFDQNDILENFKKRVDRVEEAEREIKKILNMPRNNKVQLLEEKLKEVQDKYSKEAIDKAQSESIFEIYSNPEASREEVESQYYSSLEWRIKNHRLHTADFQVIMSQESSEDKEIQKIHAFRDAFESVLESINIDTSPIDITKIDTDNPDSQANIDLIQPWLAEIEAQIGADVFRQNLTRELNEFRNPQIKDEILKGALGYFSEAIEDKINQAFDGFADNTTAFFHQKNIFLNHVRTHNAIHTPQEIKQIEGAYAEYFTHKIEGDKKVNIERNKLEGALEGLPESEKQKIRDAYEYGVNMLNNGYSTPDFDFPGKVKIQEAALQTAPIKQEFINFNRQIKDQVDDMVMVLLKEGTDKSDFDLRFNAFIQYWEQEGLSALDSKIEHFKNLCREEIFNERDASSNLIYQRFLDHYNETIDLARKKAVESIIELKRVKDAPLTGKEQVFPRIKSGLDDLLGLIDFSGGDFARYRMFIEHRLFQHKVKDENGKETIEENGFSETIQNLKDYGIFEDKDAAIKKFRKKRADFNLNLHNYETSIRKVNNRILGDIRRLSDKNFEAKYNMYKHEAQNIIERNKESVDDFNEHWRTFNKKDYFDTWLEKYNKDEVSRFNAIKEFQDFERMGETLSQISGESENLEKWLKEWEEYGATVRSNRWYNRLQMQSISLYSIYQLIKESMEIVDTRWKRKQDQMTYNIGMQIFGDSAWGKEFRRKGEESEEARVKEWETNYDELDVWTTAEYLYKTKDVDEAKACINILNKKGYLKWDNPRLWRTLMRLQSSVTFNIPEDMALEVPEISKKVGRACEIIWSKEVFRDWDTAIDENMNKAKSAHEKEFRDLTDSQVDGISALSKSLATMLEKWNKGETEDVYPDKFIAFLNLAFAQGKLNGQPDKRWYYLIKGVTTKNPQGEPLISKSTFLKFNAELLANMPYFDFFLDKSSWKKDGKIVPKDTPGAHQGVWSYEDILGWGNMMGDNNGTFLPDTSDSLQYDIERFFYGVIDRSEAARDRTMRMGRTANKDADHDDGATFFTGLEEKDVLQMLSNMSQGTQQVTDDFWRAFLSGFDLYMVNARRNIEEGDREYGLDNQNWKNDRKKILEDVGRKLKTGVTVTQVLAGSIETDQTSPLIWSEEKWEKETAYTARKGSKSKAEIDGMMFDLLDQVGGKETEQYKKELKAEYYKKSQTFKKIKEIPGWKAHSDKINHLLSDEGGSVYFKDTGKVWNVLKNYKSAN